MRHLVHFNALVLATGRASTVLIFWAHRAMNASRSTIFDMVAIVQQTLSTAGRLPQTPCKHIGPYIAYHLLHVGGRSVGRSAVRRMSVSEGCVLSVITRLNYRGLSLLQKYIFQRDCRCAAAAARDGLHHDRVDQCAVHRHMLGL